ncbi:hypothetical protein [Nocardioides sp.]|jgi:hypothetical protein|uniref:hypothetical protein n=1 Tax=Nocardioides sp. TaxID=35761 RepID=UPI0031FF0529|nr:hypothetical protein [Nocardioides sp.]
MLILGLLLIAVGALAIVAAIFSAGYSDSGHLELLGTDIGVLFLFFLGVGAGVAILWGFTVAKFGTKRQLRQRRESKKLSELSEKLDRSEHERVIERERDEDRPSL